jgi:hypothetical protein
LYKIKKIIKKNNYIFLTGAILIFIFLIPYTLNFISARLQSIEIIIQNQNFGCEILSQILKDDKSFSIIVFLTLKTDVSCSGIQ